MFNSLSTIIFLEPLYIIGRAHPLDACGLCLIFFLKKFFSPSSHRVVLVHPALIGALIKLPDCNLYRLTNNLTPDPLPRTRVLRIMDQGSSLAKLDDPCFTASYTNLTPDPLAWDLPYFATMDQGSSL